MRGVLRLPGIATRFRVFRADSCHHWHEVFHLLLVVSCRLRGQTLRFNLELVTEATAVARVLHSPSNLFEVFYSKLNLITKSDW